MAPTQIISQRTRRVGGGERFVDIVVGAVALLFLLPIFLAVAIAIKVRDPGPVFFRHKRIGRDGREFGVWKFRTMVVGAEERLHDVLANDPDAAREWQETQKLKDDPRVTPLGRFLRRSSLDELPQIFNVLRGDMSLVGPRPIVLDEAERYGHLYPVYCSVKPGMTGLWQISGRSDIEYYERVILDARYVARKSVLRDLQIMALTVPNVLSARGSV